MKGLLHSLATGSFLLVATLSAQAQNLLINGSFETVSPYIEDLLTQASWAELPPGDPTDPGTFFLSNWQFLNPKVQLTNHVLTVRGQSVSATEGSNFLSLGSFKDPIGRILYPSLSQNIVLEAGVTYRFSFDQYYQGSQNAPYLSAVLRGGSYGIMEGLFQRSRMFITGPATNGGAGEMINHLFQPLDGLSPYPTSADLYENPDYFWANLPSLDDPIWSDREAFWPEQGWFTQSFEFVPQYSGVHSFSYTPERAGFYVDNFSLTAVPEPSVMALLSLVAVSGGLWGLRRRRRPA